MQPRKQFCPAFGALWFIPIQHPRHFQGAQDSFSRAKHYPNIISTGVNNHWSDQWDSNDLTLKIPDLAREKAKAYSLSQCSNWILSTLSNPPSSTCAAPGPSEKMCKPCSTGTGDSLVLAVRLEKNISTTDPLRCSWSFIHRSLKASWDMAASPF